MDKQTGQLINWVLQKLSFLIGQLAAAHICDWLKIKWIYKPSCLLVHGQPDRTAHKLSPTKIQLSLVNWPQYTSVIGWQKANELMSHPVCWSMVQKAVKDVQMYTYTPTPLRFQVRQTYNWLDFDGSPWKYLYWTWYISYLFLFMFDRFTDVILSIRILFGFYNQFTTLSTNLKCKPSFRK